MGRGEVTAEEASAFAASLHMPYFEASAVSAREGEEGLSWTGAQQAGSVGPATLRSSQSSLQLPWQQCPPCPVWRALVRRICLLTPSFSLLHLLCLLTPCRNAASPQATLTSPSSILQNLSLLPTRERSGAARALGELAPQQELQVQLQEGQGHLASEAVVACALAWPA